MKSFHLYDNQEKWYANPAFWMALFVTPATALTEGSPHKGMRVLGLTLTILTFPYSLAAGTVLAIVMAAGFVIGASVLLIVELYKKV